eukprot:XP_008182521.2 PREDICTED: leucine-rich repeat and guanylate kinase domain-containing protein-like [Acyrthosiphon pisum]
MPLPDIPWNSPDLNRLHPIITFSRPIKDGVLNRSTLIKGLNNFIRHKEIEDYFCFTELALNNLDLKNIDIIGDYISLKKLEIHHNVIQDLSALNSLNELEYLDVSHNCLKQILNFRPPKMLYHVDYSNNNIEHMDDLSHFWSIAYLDLSYNSIKHVNGLSELNHLKFINLSHNGIKHIHYSLPCSLVEINLSCNDLESIQLDMSSSMCEILDLSHNKLKLLDFLKNAKQLSVLDIQANMIDDVLQIEYIKTLTNLRLLNVENNDFLKLNIHKQLIFSNNLPLKATIDQTFIKIDDLQELNEMEINSLLMAEKNVLKSTVLEHLSAGRSSIGAVNYCGYNYLLLPMVILVGPPKTYKKELLNTIFGKHADKFYPAIIYTTNDILCENRILKTISVTEFNKMNSTGELVFSYRFLGHSYGLNKDQLSKCTDENKVLITFTNLEGALILKNKGYNPTFVLVLPEDKLSYKIHIYESIQKYYMNQNRSMNENKSTLNKGTDGQYFNETDNNSSSSPNPDGFSIQSNTVAAVCSLETNTNAAEESETIAYRNNDIKDDFNDPVLNDPCTIFTNECMNNLNIYHNLYEKSLDVFHSLVNLHINFLHNYKKSE